MSEIPTATLPGSKGVLVGQGPTPTTLRFAVDLTKTFGLSSSGKTDLIASTSGNKVLGATGATVGLNFYCKTGTAPGLPDLEKFAEPAVSGTNVAIHAAAPHFVVIDVDCGVEGKESSSGKSQLVGSCNARAVCGTKATLGLNVYTKAGGKFDTTALATAFPRPGLHTEGQFRFDFTPKEGEDQMAESADTVVMSFAMPEQAVAATTKAKTKKSAPAVSTRGFVTSGVEGVTCSVNLSWTEPVEAATTAWADVTGATNLQWRYVKEDSGMTVMLRFVSTEAHGVSGSGKSTVVARSEPRVKSELSAGAVIAANIAKKIPRVELSESDLESLTQVAEEAAMAYLKEKAETSSLTLTNVYTAVQKALSAAKPGVVLEAEESIRQAVKKRVKKFVSTKRRRDSSDDDDEEGEEGKEGDSEEGESSDASSDEESSSDDDDDDDDPTDECSD